MIGLRIEFLASRFHANPWDRGTNEGEVEWPPSPWRLLRAITAGWHRRGETGEAERVLLVCLLDRLTEPPTFLLPRATAGHTRHYMPQGTLKNGKPDTTLVLDSFIALERGREPVACAYVIWPHVDLTREQRTTLEQCCRFVGYLGRAESWCAISVVDEIPDPQGLQLVNLASRSPGDGPTARRLAAGPSLRGGGLLVALSEATTSMRKARRLVPVGAAYAEYRLPTDFLMVREQYERSERTQSVFGPTMLRFALERGSHTPKPSIKDAVVFGELLRASVMSRYSHKEGEPVPYRLAGKGDDGIRPRQGHGHPYFLPFDSEGRGEIDGVDVWFPEGCTQPEYLAVTSVSELREHILYHDSFPLTFIGRIERVAAVTWRSATPIVLDRFPKMRGTNDSRRIVDAPAKQIEAMIGRAVGQPARVAVWPAGSGIDRGHGGRIRVDAFRRARMHRNSPPLPAIAATIQFDAPVEGPIVLGRLAHFGLGRFEPA